MCTSQRPGIRYPPFKIDDQRVAGAARLSAWQDGADAAVVDQHGSIRPYLGLDAVDQVCMRKDCLHHRLFRLELEMPWFERTVAQIGLPISGACWSSEQTTGIGADPYLL